MLGDVDRLEYILAETELLLLLKESTTLVPREPGRLGYVLEETELLKLRDVGTAKCILKEIELLIL